MIITAAAFPWIDTRWLRYSWSKIIDLCIQHVALSIPAVIISLLCALPIGYLASRKPRVGGIILSVVTLFYSIPALPLLVIVPAIFLLPLRSPWTVIIALSVYGTSLLSRTIADAFNNVAYDVRFSACAMGFNRRQLFFHIDIPLAMPIILAGLRVVIVSTISLATIGALIGVPGLGQLFTDGFKRNITTELVVGIAAVTLLALVLDWLALLLGRIITPWQYVTKTR